MCKVIQFIPSFKEANLSFERASSTHNSLFKAKDQLNIFTHQAREIPINIGKTSFEMALHFDGKDDELAKEYYLRSIENAEHLADSYCNLAIIEAESNHFIALQYFSAAINEDPCHIQSIYNLGCLYLDMCKLDLAKTYFLKSIELEPTNCSPYYNLHLVYKKQGELELAEKCLMRYKFIGDGFKGEAKSEHHFLSIST